MSSGDSFSEVQDMILQDAAKVFSRLSIDFLCVPRNPEQLQEFSFYAPNDESCGEIVMNISARSECTEWDSLHRGCGESSPERIGKIPSDLR